MSDPERLASGELVYTGALRTPVEAIVRAVPYRDGMAGVSAESFALVGDVHLWRGRLAPEDYTVPTPDGRPATREYAGERLARVICADREMLDEEAITRIADAIASEQITAVARAIRQVVSRHPEIRTAVVTGLGSFIGVDAARAAGLEVRALADDIGEDAARYAPAAAVALLCATDRGADVVTSARADASGTMRSGSPPRSTVVIKVGGGLLAHVDHLDRVLRAISDLSRDSSRADRSRGRAIRRRGPRRRCPARPRPGRGALDGGAWDGPVCAPARIACLARGCRLQPRRDRGGLRPQPAAGARPVGVALSGRSAPALLGRDERQHCRVGGGRVAGRSSRPGEAARCAWCRASWMRTSTEPFHQQWRTTALPRMTRSSC